MEIPIRYGIVLGVIVGAMGFAFAIFGLHTSETAPMVFVIAAIVINVVVVVLAMQRTAPHSNWSGQVLNGLVLGVVGAAIIFLSSWVMTAVVFPEYYAEFAEAGQRAVSAGLSAAEIEEAVAMASGTPVGTAFSGASGTVITSVVVAAITGYFKRTR